MTDADTPAEGVDPVRLVCGADLDELLEQIAEGRAAQRDAHQLACVHCQAALAEFTARWAPIAESARAAPPQLPFPEQLKALVMRRIGTLVQDVWYTLQLTNQGTISVAARVVATIARDAARSVPGVRVALGRSTQSRLAALAEKATLGHRHPHAAVGVLGRTAVIDLALAVTYGDPAHEVARAVRDEVIAELRRNIGLTSVIVNVTVDDVLTD